MGEPVNYGASVPISIESVRKAVANLQQINTIASGALLYTAVMHPLVFGSMAYGIDLDVYQETEFDKELRIEIREFLNKQKEK